MTAPQWQFKPGEEVDRYRIERPLGMGGVGEVYEAVHRFTNRRVALKCLQLRRATKEDFRDRMRAEAQVLSELNHPNVVRLFDADITPNGVVWMATELLTGVTLRELLAKNGALAFSRAFRFAAAIGEGAAAAHRIGVFHRDLKPENVFVTTTDEIKVLDFGTAKFTDRGVKTTDQMRILGTPYYMAPEQFTAQPVDGRTDVYQLGMIHYEMLTGRHAFSVGDELPPAHQIGEVHLYAMPEPLMQRLPGFPPAAWAVIERAVRKDRLHRYTSMDEYVAAIRDAAAREQREGRAPLSSGTIPSRPAVDIVIQHTEEAQTVRSPKSKLEATERMFPSPMSAMPSSSAPQAKGPGMRVNTPPPMLAATKPQGPLEPSKAPSWLPNVASERAPLAQSGGGQQQSPFAQSGGGQQQSPFAQSGGGQQQSPFAQSGGGQQMSPLAQSGAGQQSSPLAQSGAGQQSSPLAQSYAGMPVSSQRLTPPTVVDQVLVPASKPAKKSGGAAVAVVLVLVALTIGGVGWAVAHWWSARADAASSG